MNSLRHRERCGPYRFFFFSIINLTSLKQLVTCAHSGRRKHRRSGTKGRYKAIGGSRGFRWAATHGVVSGSLYRPGRKVSTFPAAQLERSWEGNGTRDVWSGTGKITVWSPQSHVRLITGILATAGRDHTVSFNVCFFLSILCKYRSQCPIPR